MLTGLVCRLRMIAAPTGLFTDAQLSDDIEIPLRIFTSDVVEQTSATTDQTQQAATRGIILAMGSHVLGQPIDALGQDGNLHLGRAGIGVRLLMLADYLCFSLFRDRHSF